MSAAIVAVDSPYFGVSDVNGHVQIFRVLEGKCMLHAWSEQGIPEELKKLEREVTITPSTHDLGTIQIKANPDFTTEHKNKYGQDYVTPSSAEYSRP